MLLARVPNKVTKGEKKKKEKKEQGPLAHEEQWVIYLFVLWDCSFTRRST